MMYRVVFFMEVDDVAFVNRSKKIASFETANNYLDALIEVEYFIGGYIEMYVDGIGWVIYGE